MSKQHSHHEEHHHHSHDHGDEHGQHEHNTHAHAHEHGYFSSQKQRILTVRAMSGLAGDMMLCGLARMSDSSNEELAELTASLKLPGDIKVSVGPREVMGIHGWGATVTIPHEHSHRSFHDIKGIIEASALSPAAKEISLLAFARLAEAEGRAHGRSAAEVTFHEVGALDSILDICLSCALFAKLAPNAFVCSPLPLADGSVFCAHGWIPTPAPAVLDMLDAVPVTSFAGQGETVTPTAITLLKAMGADFGPWPAMRIHERALVYGGKVFPNAPNGSIWAWGESL